MGIYSYKKQGEDYLISREGYTISTYNHRKKRNTPNYAPLEYMLYLNPKTAVYPRGFRSMLRAECPKAWYALCNNAIVCGHRLIDIMEKNFEHITEKRAW